MFISCKEKNIENWKNQTTDSITNKKQTIDYSSNKNQVTDSLNNQNQTTDSLIKENQAMDSLSHENQTIDSINKEVITEFKILNKSNYNLSKLNHDGKFVNKRVWQDANGENVALFTQTENELFLYHYLINSDTVKLLRKIYDFERDCQFDLIIEFIENSITVTDLDNNNLGEITFAYKQSCFSDVSPLGLKLIMLENGNKYIIRGTTEIDMDELKIASTKTIDPSFKNASTNFLLHANKIWEDTKKQ